MTDELKPCPFCGGEAEYHTDKGPTGEAYGWVGCNRCDATSCCVDVRSMQPEELHPIDAWNTRQPDPAVLVETLKTANAWLERWADHVGNCHDNPCECGLTRVQYETSAALAQYEKDKSHG